MCTAAASFGCCFVRGEGNCEQQVVKNQGAKHCSGCYCSAGGSEQGRVLRDRCRQLVYSGARTA